MKPKKQANNGVESTGNIFADLGLKNPEILHLKAELSLKVRHEIKKRGLTQNKAALLLGISQSDVSRFSGQEFERFSVEKYFSFLEILGLRIEVNVRKPTKAKPVGLAFVSK